MLRARLFVQLQTLGIPGADGQCIACNPSRHFQGASQAPPLLCGSAVPSWWLQGLWKQDIWLDGDSDGTQSLRRMDSACGDMGGGGGQILVGAGDSTSYSGENL